MQCLGELFQVLKYEIYMKFISKANCFKTLYASSNEQSLSYSALYLTYISKNSGEMHRFKYWQNLSVKLSHISIFEELYERRNEQLRS